MEIDPTKAYITSLIDDYFLNQGQLPTRGDIYQDITQEVLPNYLYTAQPYAYPYDRIANMYKDMQLPYNQFVPTFSGPQGIFAQGANFFKNRFNNNANRIEASPQGIDSLIIPNAPGGFERAAPPITQSGTERFTEDRMAPSKRKEFKENKKRFADRYNPNVGFTKGR